MDVVVIVFISVNNTQLSVVSVGFHVIDDDSLLTGLSEAELSRRPFRGPVGAAAGCRGDVDRRRRRSANNCCTAKIALLGRGAARTAPAVAEHFHGGTGGLSGLEPIAGL